MTDKKDQNSQWVDDLLARAADLGSPSSVEFLARIVADADMVAVGRDGARTRGRSARASAVFSDFLATFGGWPTMAGLTTAAVAGILIGYASPDTLGGITDFYFATGNSETLVDFMPTFSDILDEG